MHFCAFLPVTTVTTITATARPSCALQIFLWVLQIALAAAFLMCGLMKLVMPLARLAQHLRWVNDDPAALTGTVALGRTRYAPIPARWAPAATRTCEP